MMVVSFLGWSGAGKSTLAERLRTLAAVGGLHMRHLNVGHELRMRGGGVRHSQAGLDEREDLVRDMVRREVLTPAGPSGHTILDGFPRTPGQAAWLASLGKRCEFVYLSNVNARSNLVGRSTGDMEKLAATVATACRQEAQLSRTVELVRDMWNHGSVGYHSCQYDNDYSVADGMLGGIVQILNEGPAVEVVADDGTWPPRRKYQTDAGFDLAARLMNPRMLVVAPGARAVVHTGVRISVPQGFAARIISRSSTYVSLGLEVYEGIIDTGYTGELKIFVMNRTPEPIKIEDGQRLAQVVFFPVVTPSFRIVKEFSPTERGEAGFGSTGK